MNQKIEIQLPMCIGDKTPEDILAGIKLFYQNTLCDKVSFSIDGDIGGNHDRLREEFGEFIKIAHLRETRPHVQMQDPESTTSFMRRIVSTSFWSGMACSRGLYTR